MQAQDCVQVYEIEQIAFPSTTWTLEDFQNSLLSKDQLYFVAHNADRIVGFAALYTMIDSADLVNIAVHPDFRRQGVADNLMETLLAKADSLYIDTVTLEVRIHNVAAIHLYEKYNFHKIAVRKAYYQNPPEDAGIMQRSK